MLRLISSTIRISTVSFMFLGGQVMASDTIAHLFHVCFIHILVDLRKEVMKL